MVDIVERLRRMPPELDIILCENVLQAADEIERLRDEADHQLYKRKDAEDEIERLREALRTIGYGPPHEGEPLDLLNQFVDLARAALKGDE